MKKSIILIMFLAAFSFSNTVNAQDKYYHSGHVVVNWTDMIVNGIPVSTGYLVDESESYYTVTYQYVNSSNSNTYQLSDTDDLYFGNDEGGNVTITVVLHLFMLDPYNEDYHLYTVSNGTWSGNWGYPINIPMTVFGIANGLNEL